MKLAEIAHLLRSTLLSALAGVGLLAIFMWVDATLSGNTSSGLFLGVLLVYAFFILMGILCVGVPAHLLLKKFNFQTLLPYALVGIIPPILVVITGKPFGDDGIWTETMNALLAGAFGFACATTFWYAEVKAKRL